MRCFERNTRQALLQGYAVVLSLLLGACGSMGSHAVVEGESLQTGNPHPDIFQLQEDVSVEPYVISSGDKLSIKFFFNPELNEEDLIVRPDGYLSLQLVHEIKAAGLTPPELTKLLAEKYSGVLKNPEVAVIVRSVRNSYRIYVGGQVTQPGEYEIVGSLSVLQAIALARGMQEDTAQTGNVVVLRRGNNKQPFVIKVDLEAALNGEDLRQNIQLLPFDYVYVPRSFW